MRWPTLLALFVIGCGTAGGSSGGGAQNPPNAQLGPFAPITTDVAPNLTVPYVLASQTSEYDDPEAHADGQTVVLYVTERDVAGTTSSIARATTTDLRQGFGAPSDVLSADQPWEMGAIAHASLTQLSDGTLLLFYAGGGSLGAARSQPHATWGNASFTKLGPILSPDGTTETTPLTSPSAVQIDGRLRIYYIAGGVVWAADSALADWSSTTPPTLTRLDAATLGLPPAHPTRAPFAVAQGSADATITQARARVYQTPLRPRYDVYFSGAGNGTVSYAAFAASYDPTVTMQIAASPLTVGAGANAPTVVPFGGDAILVYSSSLDGLAAIAVALGPEVAF